MELIGTILKIMTKTLNIAVLDSVPKSDWDNDEGITGASKFVDLLIAENQSDLTTNLA